MLEAGDFSIHESLPFGDEDVGLTLDLYLPNDQVGAVPCVVTIQGGGFLPQDGKRFKPFAERLATHGIASALISYRGRPDHTFRETMSDVWASIRFVRENAERYGLNPDQIGVTGRSAGGTLAALVAVQGREDGPRKRVQAAVCFAGVYDFIGRFTDAEQLAAQPRAKTKLKTNGDWIGSSFSATNPDWISASAIRHGNAGDPPVLLLHSKDDRVVPWQQSRDMHAALLDAGIESELKLYENGGHAVDPRSEDTLDVMVAYFAKHLFE